MRGNQSSKKRLLIRLHGILRIEYALDAIDLIVEIIHDSFIDQKIENFLLGNEEVLVQEDRSEGSHDVILRSSDINGK